MPINGRREEERGHEQEGERSQEESWGLRERGKGNCTEKGKLKMELGQSLEKQLGWKVDGKGVLLLSRGKPHCWPILALH